MDGLGCFLKIFKKNPQKRLKAKVDLRNNYQRLEQPPVVQMAWKFCHYGWFGMDFENIQADPSKEARVDLRGHQTNKVKMIQFWGTPTTHTCILEAW